jgi:CheY-like chemotaxis protein
MNELKTLVLVDDDEIIAYVTKRIIADTNLVNLIKVFPNGKEAINYLRENSANPDMLPEILFLDLFMPIMDGWHFLDEFTKIKHEINKQIDIYIITSSISQEDIDRAKKINEVSDYIIKPITRKNFLEIIQKIC